MFDGFACEYIDVGETTLRVRYAGSGPAILLLHGHPRTHTTWHRVAPLLAQTFTVVCPDLRGYGKSSKPSVDANPQAYSKRAMAMDMKVLMQRLGFERFAVAGHDRGAYVALRLALDQPAAVSHLCIMEAVPIGEALARCNRQFASSWWHWFFLGHPARLAEPVINADPDAWYGSADQKSRMGEENWQDYLRAIHDPETVRAMCEDYRAGITTDREHDDADRRNGRRVVCPTFVLWAEQDDLEDLYGDVLAVWRPWAEQLRGGRLDCGHHIAEERPREFAEMLENLLAQERL